MFEGVNKFCKNLTKAYEKINYVIVMKHSTADKICSRVYYVICTATDIVQTSSKIVFTVLTSTIAIMFLGQSKICNKWKIHAYKDCLFSIKMLRQSIRGIIDPKGAYHAKIQLHVRNFLNNFLIIYPQDSVSTVEKIGSGILSAGKGITNITNIAMSITRFISAFLMYKISNKNSKMMSILFSGAITSIYHSMDLTSHCFKATVYQQPILIA